MPRTKVQKKTTNKLDDSVLSNNDKLIMIQYMKTVVSDITDAFKENLFRVVEESTTEFTKQFSEDILNTKIKDLKSTSVISAKKINLSCKEDVKTSKYGKKKITQDSSLTDEGYLTTESSNSVDRTSSHQPRSKIRKTETKGSRVTRSLSKTFKGKTDISTPSNQPIPKNTYGIVTPKCKPNSTHVLLRRPKKNEVALSLQGSPLLTAPVATDDVANINIPLRDGTLVSLLPQDGLRLSQIPHFDHETLKQLKTLNSHIQMVLSSMQTDSH